MQGQNANSEGIMQRYCGRLETGVGDFGKWIRKLADHYHRKTGLLLYPGTLNVRLAAPFDLPVRRERLEAHEYGGTVSVNIVPCRIFDRPAVILRTDKNEADTGQHERSVVEIATDFCLRETHELSDGDTVCFELEGDLP